MRTLHEGTTEQLECVLVVDELLARANSLALTCQDIEREDGRQSQIKADMKATLAKLQAEQSRLMLIVARKAEPREVRVTTYADDDAAEAVTVREDTGEVIRRRALDLSERQLTLPTGDDDDDGTGGDARVLAKRPAVLAKGPAMLALDEPLANLDDDGTDDDSSNGTKPSKRRRR